MFFLMLEAWKSGFLKHDCTVVIAEFLTGTTPTPEGRDIFPWDPGPSVGTQIFGGAQASRGDGYTFAFNRAHLPM